MDDEEQREHDALAKLAEVTRLENGEMPVSGLAIVSYFDENGKQNFAWAHMGDVPISDVVGDLETVKHELLMSAWRQNHMRETDD